MKTLLSLLLVSFSASAQVLGLQSPAIAGWFPGSAAAVVPSVDILIDAEGASVGVVTVARLFDGAHTNANLGRYGVEPNPQLRNWITNDFNIPLIAPLAVNGTTYPGTGGTKRIRGLLTTLTEHDFILTNATEQGKMSIGFFFSKGPTGNLGDFLDLVQIEGHGEYAVAGIVDDAGASKFIRIHSNTNFGSTGPNLLIKTNFYYYVQISWDTNSGPTGYSVLELRNGTNGAFIGRSALGHGAKQMAQTVRVMKTDIHTFGENHEVTVSPIWMRFNQTGTTPTNYVWQ